VRKRKPGFTLVELLVVIAIMAILMALLLPAVQAAREASRRAQCRNHLKQLALAFLTHENSLRFFPSGGWGQGRTAAWGSVPGRGFGLKQPGGWAYNTLPFLEEQPLHELGLGAWGADYLQAGTQRIHTVLSLHNCPSRRGARLYPNTVVKLKPYEHYGTQMPSLVAKTDYAVNVGKPRNTCCPGHSPSSLAAADHPSTDWLGHSRQSHRDHEGISFVHSCVRPKDVSDGLSRTYLIGEKHLAARFYETGESEGDDGTLYASHNSDMYRSTHESPLQDLNPSDPRDRYEMFGSVHEGAFQMAMCDGSVHGISYSIDPPTHQALGTRRGREPVEMPD
jgi:prepilin-type N-terminal cleavage/methylation domain-containing protein